LLVRWANAFTTPLAWLMGDSAGIIAIAAFVVRELAAGVLRAAGQDALRWAKRYTRNRAQGNGM
jgi:hypothetical protein